MTNFYPDKPTKHHRITKIMQLTGWKPKFMYWQDKTVCDYRDMGEGINRHCTDIRKSTVEKHFKRAFGYGTEPVAVVKSEKNYAHDGKIVPVPVEAPEGKIYQRLIDTWNGNEYVEYRAVIVNGRVVCWLEKRKPQRFKASGMKMTCHKELFDTEPVEEFARLIGMDYGELDYLVDKIPFIIDANKTPGGAGKIKNIENKDLFIDSHRGLFV